MKRPLVILFAFLAILTLTLSLSATENATITGDGLRIRSGPSTDDEILGKLDSGTRVTVKARSWEEETIGGNHAYWYLIFYNGIEGYVFGHYLEIDTGVKIPSDFVLSFGRGEPKSAPNPEDCAITIVNKFPDTTTFIIWGVSKDGTTRILVEGRIPGGGNTNRRVSPNPYEWIVIEYENPNQSGSFEVHCGEVAEIHLED